MTLDQLAALTRIAEAQEKTVAEQSKCLAEDFSTKVSEIERCRQEQLAKLFKSHNALTKINSATLSELRKVGLINLSSEKSSTDGTGNVNVSLVEALIAEATKKGVVLENLLRDYENRTRNGVNI